MSSNKKIFVMVSPTNPDYYYSAKSLTAELNKNNLSATCSWEDPKGEYDRPSWISHIIQKSDYVLVIADSNLKAEMKIKQPQKDIRYAGTLIHNYLHQFGDNNKFIPILLNSSSPEDIPFCLTGYTYYQIFGFQKRQNFEKLITFLKTGKSSPNLLPLGKLPSLPPLKKAPCLFDSDDEYRTPFSVIKNNKQVKQFSKGHGF